MSNNKKRKSTKASFNNTEFPEFLRLKLPQIKLFYT